jgi:hypothetical protein
MKSTTANTLFDHDSLTAAPRNNGTGLTKNSKDKRMKRFCIVFVMGVLAVIVGASVANAQVTVNSLSLPTSAYPAGAPIPGGIDGTVGIGDPCQSFSAFNQPLPNETVGYELLFWDNQGTIVWPTSGSSTTTVEVCPGSTKGLATAWYEQVCVPGQACNGSCTLSLSCSVTTLAFNTYSDEFLANGDGTPIASVAPNSPEVWTGGTTVNTSYSAEAITVNSSLYGTMTKYGGGEFLYWEQMPKTNPGTPPGLVYNAPIDFDGYVVAFYLTIPPPPPPPHCHGTLCT